MKLTALSRERLDRHGLSSPDLPGAAEHRRWEGLKVKLGVVAPNQDFASETMTTQNGTPYDAKWYSRLIA